MRTPTLRAAGLLAAGAIACGTFIAAGTPVLAQNDPPPGGRPDPAAAPVVAATSTVTLPLLGAPLIVDVGTDAGGRIIDVALNQADDYTANKIRPNGVSFVNDAGTTKVHVGGHWGGQAVAATAATLADVSGPGEWSGDVFGDGETSTVTFNVGTTAEGGPDITDVAVTSTATFEIGPTEYRDGDRRGADKQAATATVTFERNGQRRALRISVVVKTWDDGSKANVVVGLSGLHGRALVEGDPVGTHTWSGALCDGTPASITYTVSADGVISDVTATPDAQVHDRGVHAWVAFSRREAVVISTGDRGWKGEHRGDESSGQDELEVGTWERFRCERVDPAVNTDIAPDADERGDREHRHDKGWHGKGWNGDHRGDRAHWGGDRDGDRGDRWTGDERDNGWGDERDDHDRRDHDDDHRDRNGDRGDRGDRERGGRQRSGR